MTGAGSPSEAPADRPSIRQAVGAALVYLALAIVLTSSTWADPTHRWIGICCDQEQSIWFLAWLPTALEQGQNPFLTDRLNAPDGVNLMWNASSPLVALLVAPITRTLGPILAYNVAAVVVIALSGLLGFVALRRYASRPIGPLVAGGLYALSPYVASHAALHLNLISAWGPPVVLILLDEVLIRRDHRPEVIGVGLAVAAGLQLLTSEEVLATSAVAAAVLVIVLAVGNRRGDVIRDRLRRLLRAGWPALVVFGVLAALPLAVQFLGPQQIHGPVQDPAAYSTDLLNLILPTSYQIIAPDAVTDVSSQFSGLFHEATGYIGLPLLVVLGWIVVVRRRDLVVRVAAAMVVVMFVLSLGPELHVAGESWQIPLPWWPLAQLPLLEHVLPGRLTLYMWLAVAVLVAVAIDQVMVLHVTASSVRARAVRLALIGLALIFVVPAPAASSTASVPAFFRSWSQQGVGPHEIVLFAPWFANGAGADPMLWAAVAEAQPRIREGYVYVPDANGHPRFGPDGGQLARLMTLIQDRGVARVARGATRATILRELVTAQISVVIVGPMRYRSQMVTMFTDLLDAPAVETDGVEIWRDVPGLVNKAASPLP